MTNQRAFQIRALAGLSLVALALAPTASAQTVGGAGVPAVSCASPQAGTITFFGDPVRAFASTGGAATSSTTARATPGTAAEATPGTTGATAAQGTTMAVPNLGACPFHTFEGAVPLAADATFTLGGTGQSGQISAYFTFEWPGGGATGAAATPAPAMATAVMATPMPQPTVAAQATPAAQVTPSAELTPAAQATAVATPIAQVTPAGEAIATPAAATTPVPGTARGAARSTVPIEVVFLPAPEATMSGAELLNQITLNVYDQNRTLVSSASPMLLSGNTGLLALEFQPTRAGTYYVEIANKDASQPVTFVVSGIAEVVPQPAFALQTGAAGGATGGGTTEESKNGE